MAGDGVSSGRGLNFLLRVFRGDAGLARTFWIFGIMVPFLLLMVFLEFTEMVIDWPKFGCYYEAVAYGFFVGMTGYIVLIYVAVWRSSGKYAGPRAWKYLARAWALVCWLVLLPFGWMYIESALFLLLMVTGECLL